MTLANVFLNLPRRRLSRTKEKEYRYGFDMYPKNRLNIITAVLLVSLILMSYLHEAEGQLNFSTGWGKRSRNIPADNTSNSKCFSQGGPSLEQLYNLYNFIQIEAQKIADRQKFNK